ncbi:MAG: helix-turn-helix domain-containing protein [Planctomycetes bacterium]|nr:helix-turn-helix domain-containing protein [Planctomycetota bacterium]
MSKSVEVVQIEPLAVRPKQAAQMLSVSLRKFHSMRSCGQLPPAIKIGGCLLYRVADLRLYVELSCPPIEKFIALTEGDG